MSVTEGPGYIAFRVLEGDGLVPVVAALDPGDRTGFPWAKWYSELAPDGEFRKVPGDYDRLGIPNGIARTMIELIQAGRSLPDEMVVRLTVL